MADRSRKPAGGAGSAAGKKTAAKEATAKKPAAKKTATKKPAAKKTATKKTATKGTPAASKRTAGTKSASVPAQGSVSAAPTSLPVPEEETPWSEEELAGVRADIEAEIARFRAEIASAEHQLAELIQDSSSGAGDDQVDSGSKAFEREHEMTLANNARLALAQAEHARERIVTGTYGTCEGCGDPIGKRRLQAFPRATLCMPCKQRQERH